MMETPEFDQPQSAHTIEAKEPGCSLPVADKVKPGSIDDILPVIGQMIVLGHKYKFTTEVNLDENCLIFRGSLYGPNFRWQRIIVTLDFLRHAISPIDSIESKLCGP